MHMYHSAWILAFASSKKRNGEAKGANSNSVFAPGKLRWNPYSVTLYKVHCKCIVLHIDHMRGRNERKNALCHQRLLEFNGKKISILANAEKLKA